jgi:DNA ligase-1
MIKRPILAEKIEPSELENLKYPVLVSPKLDGIRCLIVDGKALSRSFKPIPNLFIQSLLSKQEFNGLDGELILEGKTFNETQSIVMSESSEPVDFVYYCFDYVGKNGLNHPFELRLKDLGEVVQESKSKWMVAVPQLLAHSSETIITTETTFLSQGYEGLMIRGCDSPYKNGRSTKKEGYLLKLKKFEDAEAVVIGFVEATTNTNELEKNELGLSKRSHKKAGKVRAGYLGAFLVKDLKTGTEFEIGTGDGLTKDLRAYIWNNQDKYLNKLIKYKHQPSGSKDKPRFPVWLGFRDERDLS